MPRMPVSARSGRRGNGAAMERETGRPSRRSPSPPAYEQSEQSRTLSAADAAFLYLERKEMPLAIACVTIFDGPIPFDAFVASIASKLDRVPRYQQVVVTPPLNIDLPTWEDDLHFDIRRHILRVAVEPPGGEAELEALAGRIFSKVLDRSKPLWEIYVVEGLKDRRGALIWRLHHALADGISGSRLLEVFLDAAPEGSPALRRPRQRPPQPSNGAPADGISAVVHSTLGSLIATERGLLGFAQALLGDPKQEGSKSLLDLLPELLVSVERLPFNKPCGEGRKFCWAEFDMAEVQAIREVVGGRVNDVILTVLTRALARYVMLHGQSIMKRFVRIVCPVNLRKPGQVENLGNQISFIPVALPMDVQDPAEMLRAIAARTETMKRSGAAALLGLTGALIAKAPPAMQALFWWGLPELILPVPLFNMICTNLPGPPMPLYALGKRMIAAYPQVPTGYDLGINCAVESYDGKLFFGLVADAQVASDVSCLRDFLYVSFQELRAAARKQARAAAKQLRPTRRKSILRGRSARQHPLKPAEVVAPVIPEPLLAPPEAAPSNSGSEGNSAA
jgi:diacylglycerol O-acyltransferase / wax synthase